MSMLLSRMARGSTCSNLSRRIWRCISQRRRASWPSTGVAMRNRTAARISCFIFTIRYIQRLGLGDHKRLPNTGLAQTTHMNLHMLLVRWLAAATFVGVAGLAAAQTTQNGGIDYDAARNERKLPATQTQEPITLDGKLDEPAWAAAMLATGFVQNDP